MGEPLESKHHLFSYYEIRAKLIEIFGEPKSDEDYRKLSEEAKKCKKMMPIYKIDHQLHKSIHGKG